MSQLFDEYWNDLFIDTKLLTWFQKVHWQKFVTQFGARIFPTKGFFPHDFSQIFIRKIWICNKNFVWNLILFQNFSVLMTASCEAWHWLDTLTLTLDVNVKFSVDVKCQVDLNLTSMSTGNVKFNLSFQKVKKIIKLFQRLIL